MDSERQDLDSILESARTQLEMYRRGSQENIDMAKEKLLEKTKDVKIEELESDQEEEEEGGGSSQQDESSKDLDKTNSKVGSFCNEEKISKDSKERYSTPEVDDELFEDEESSNKNFDSSTISLGDQQSFQNQTELTSQTTYTNIHNQAAGAKDEVVVLTATPPAEETTTSKQSTILETPSTATTSCNEKQDPAIPNINQMAGNVMYFGGWKMDSASSATNEEVIISETYPVDKKTDEIAVEKGDVVSVEAAKEEEATPVKMCVEMINEVTEKLGELRIDEESMMIHDTEGAFGTNSGELEACACTRTTGIILALDEGPKSILHYPPTIKVIQGNDDSRVKFVNVEKQMEFVDNYDELNRDQETAPMMDSLEILDKNEFEDEGFVDLKETAVATKVIFVAEDEDDTSSKPFDPEENSPSIESSTCAELGLEAKQSLTDVRATIEQVRKPHESSEGVSISANAEEIEFNLPDVPESQPGSPPEITLRLKTLGTLIPLKATANSSDDQAELAELPPQVEPSSSPTIEALRPAHKDSEVRQDSPSIASEVRQDSPPIAPEVPALKTPPRPPPRLRQPQPPRNKKLNFLKRLFGRNVRP